MPWTPKQMKTIRAKKHGWDPEGDDEPFAGVSKGKLGKMEKEGLREAKSDPFEKKGFPFKKSKKKKKSLHSQMIAMKAK